MEQKVPRLRSTKKVLSLDRVLKERVFVLPSKMANSFDTSIGEPCLYVAVNGVNTYIPVGTPTHISYANFCVLKDLGILETYSSFEEGDLLK